RDFHVTGVQTCALPICLVNQREVGAAILTPEGDYKTAQITVGPNDAKSLREPKTYSYIRQGLPSAISKHIRKSIASGIAGVIDRSEERRVGKECRSQWG